MSARTVFTVLEETTQRHPDAPALQQPLGKGKYRTYTWTEFRDAAREIACGLRSLGVQPGENVAVYSETRAEFYLADIGIMAAGAVAAALYVTYPLPDQIRNLRAAEVRTIFVENPKSLRALLDQAGAPGLAARMILLEGSATAAGDARAITLDGLREEGRRALQNDPAFFDKIRASVSPRDYAVLYLTSGATGEPKMGLATHAALVANADMAPEVLPLTPQDRTIVFLPSAHIAQRVVLELVPLRTGAVVWFSESLNRLPQELRAIRPTFFLAPPRVWERMFASIQAEVKKKSRLQRKIFHGAVGLGDKANILRQGGKPVPRWMQTALKAAHKLVFSKIHARMGGQLRIAASGAAPLGKELAEFFGAIGMPLIEGYGLTEGGVATLNPLDRPKFGSIGKALPGVQVKLAEDGELLVKSPCLFSGYYKDPEATAAVLKDGWLYTGDIAEIDQDGYVFITGRKKELIVASNGKKIYPARIEGLFKMEPIINHVVLIGDRLPYVTALITVNAVAAEPGGGANLQESVKTAVARVNKSLPPFEQIRKFRVLERDFSIDHGELTPTMKIRRARVLENHRAAISEMYMGKEESQ